MCWPGNRVAKLQRVELSTDALFSSDRPQLPVKDPKRDNGSGKRTELTERRTVRRERGNDLYPSGRPSYVDPGLG